MWAVTASAQSVFEFSHQILTGHLKWIRHDNPKSRKYAEKTSHIRSWQTRTFFGKKLTLLCIWRDQNDAIYCEILRANETITSKLYQRQLMELSPRFETQTPPIWQDDFSEFNPRCRKCWKISQGNSGCTSLKYPARPLCPPDIAPWGYHPFSAVWVSDRPKWASHFTKKPNIRSIAWKARNFLKAELLCFLKHWEKGIVVLNTE